MATEEIGYNEVIRFDVVNGPSREALFDALRLRTANNPVTVLFQLEKYGSIPLSIIGIGSEAGTGEHWTIKTYNPAANYGRRKAKGYYNTTTRKGRLEIVG